MNEPVANPFPSFEDVVWSFLQLAGVPFLVLVPAMLVLWILDWIHTARRVTSGAAMVASSTRRGFDALNARAAFRVGLLVALQSAAVACIYGAVAWLTAMGPRFTSGRPTFEELVDQVLGDPAAQKAAFTILWLSVGLALAFDGAMASRNTMAIKITGVACVVLMYGLGLLGLGAVVLGAFGLLAYGMPPDHTTAMWIGLAVLAAIGVPAAIASDYQVKRVFPERARA
ncbi:hypothetical protein IC744_16170 [Microbacterium hominis]|uniref:hypothetical protein n=1 Tax=Microbacterium hominis TaxID=162426 RepID=UPI00168BBBF3|nr:hypothetical protein [Microbacterium hominis]QOC24798.1 hypothetical protein IC745_10415 [Microbacterium hominis]QOC28852.1 hypothetical protein IC744_16170 [Microbacterium hominis]